MTRILVGLVGQKRSGKDTVGDVLEALGYGRRAFADKVREVLLGTNPWVHTEATSGISGRYRDRITSTRKVRLQEVVDSLGWDGAKEIPEVRRLLQDHGVATRTALGPDVWIAPVMAEAALADRFVITDARFSNEIAAIRAAGGIIVRVDRPGLPDHDRHVSENEWRVSGCDALIENDTTLSVLVARVIEFHQQIVAP